MIPKRRLGFGFSSSGSPGGDCPLVGAAPGHRAPATTPSDRAAAPHSFRSRRDCTRGRPGTGRRTNGSLLPSRTRTDRDQGNLLSTCEEKAADNHVKPMLCKKAISCTKGKPDTAGDPAMNCCLSFLLFTTTSQDKQTQKKPICTGLRAATHTNHRRQGRQH